MTENQMFLSPNYNIAHRCIGEGIGHGDKANFTVRIDKTIGEKYRNIFRGNMDKEGSGRYTLQLPQPCLISRVEFLIYDRGPNIRPAHYRIEYCLYNHDLVKNEWLLLYESNKTDNPEGHIGLQNIRFDPTPMTYIRIIPTELFRYKMKRIFSIVDFKCFGPKTEVEKLDPFQYNYSP